MHTLNKVQDAPNTAPRHTDFHGMSAMDKDNWRARNNRKPLKVTRKKWLSED